MLPRLISPNSICALLLAGLISSASAGGFTRIGEVTQLSGEASCRFTGTSELGTMKLKVGKPIYYAPQCWTSPGAKMQVKTVDDSLFTVAENTVFTFQKYIFDPSTKYGALCLELAQGTLRFAGGQIASANPERFHIHMGTIGIAIAGRTDGIITLDSHEIRMGVLSGKAAYAPSERDDMEPIKAGYRVHIGTNAWVRQTVVFGTKELEASWRQDTGISWPATFLPGTDVEPDPDAHGPPKSFPAGEFQMAPSKP